MDVTLITGASSGIGEALARRLAADGHHLFLVARSEQKLRALGQELRTTHSIQAHYLAQDLSAPEAADAIYAAVERQQLRVTMLVNNAGVGTAGDFTKLDLGAELRLMQLNMGALVALTHLFLKPMRAANRGTIINVASMAAFQPCPFMATYGASKMFVKSFTEALAEENKPFNIQLLLLCPGATETRFFEAAAVNEADKKALLNGSALETPEQVVETALQGLRAHQRVAISGAGNRWLARLGGLLPTRLLVKTIGDSMRKQYQ